MADIFVEEDFYMGTSQACIVDLVPPVFGGINFLDVESRGQIRAGWSAASDANNPIRYEVYIQASTATGLFNFANITGITDKLQLDIFTLPDGSFLQNGQTYHVGVRAVDAIGNRDANTVSSSVISTGVLTSIDTYEVHASWSVGDSNLFKVTLWANKNGSLAISPSAILGTASFQVYDRLGNPVAGMSGSGVSANSQGLFSFPEVANLTDLLNNSYTIRASVIVDGEARVNFVEVLGYEKQYKLDGVADVSPVGEIIGSFWISRNGQLVTDNLGEGSFEVYNSSGVLLPLAETGITATPAGFFVISPLTPPAPLDPTQAFIVRVRVEVDGIEVEQKLILGNEPAVYDVKTVFSINALNQLQATLWATENNQVLTGPILGTASYEIYDRTGALVSGISESGIVANANGQYVTTPANAVLLTDLTHYTAKVTITVAGVDRIAIKGFTLLGT